LGIFVNNDLNELNFIKIENKKKVYDKKYRLTIIPTLDCNFNCWYCYETHNKEVMSSSTIESIIKHVEYMIKKERINGLELDWFGGEPLLHFYDIILPVSKRIKNIFTNKQLEFTHVITTNGYLIDKKMAMEFDKVNLKNFQITLDGNETLHNKVRKTKDGRGSYNEIVNAVNTICTVVTNPDVMLRINYTNQNLKTINEIIKDFPVENRKYIKVFFQQVWQLENKNKPVNIESILKLFKDAGFRIEFSRFNRDTVACYADKYYQAVINYNGYVYKCTARDFDDTKHSDGFLNKEGVIEWIPEKFYKRLGSSTFENEFCENCKLLPLCYGPCSQKLLELTDNSPEQFKRICYEGGVKIGLERLFIEFYEKHFDN